MVQVENSLPLDQELAAVAASAAGLLLTENTVAETLKLITSVAKSIVPYAAGSGVTLIDANARKSSAAASDEVVERADALQYELEQGPCLSAWAAGETIVVQDIVADERWTDWSAAVTPLGIASSISVPLTYAQETFGAVKVYSTEAQAFTERSRAILELLAQQAAVLLRHATTAEQAKKLSEDLRSTLHSRDVIGMARGILMERLGLDADAAARHLMKQAVSEGRPLGEIAAGLVEAAGRQGS